MRNADPPFLKSIVGQIEQLIDRCSGMLVQPCVTHWLELRDSKEKSSVQVYLLYHFAFFLLLSGRLEESILQLENALLHLAHHSGLVKTLITPALRDKLTLNLIQELSLLFRYNDQNALTWDYLSIFASISQMLALCYMKVLKLDKGELILQFLTRLPQHIFTEETSQAGDALWTNRETYYLQGVIQYLRADFEATLKSTQESLKGSPSYIAASLLRAMAFIKVGQCDLARKEVELCLSHGDHKVRIYNLLGTIAALQVSPSLSIDEY